MILLQSALISGRGRTGALRKERDQTMKLLNVAPQFFCAVALGIRRFEGECSRAPCVGRRKLAIPTPARRSLQPARLSGRIQFDHDGKLE